MREKVIQILQSVDNKIDYEKEEWIMSSKLWDSMQIVSGVVMLSNEFNIDIDFKSIIPDNFDSVDKIVAFIEKEKDRMKQ